MYAISLVLKAWDVTLNRPVSNMNSDEGATAIIEADSARTYRHLDSLVRLSGTDRAKRSVLLVAVFAFGLILRLLTLRQFAGDIDEPASLLAIKRTSELGMPLFPSGVLYLQGAFFSYLAAPIAWLLDDTALLDATRFFHVFLASLIIPLSMKLVHMLTGSLAAMVLAGILVASDPTLIAWSVAIRPYGILAVVVTALLLLFIFLVRDGATARLLRVRVVFWVPVVGLLGAFTHIGFWLVVPPLALAGAVIWNRSLFTTNRGILFSGLAMLPSLLAYFLLGRVSGAGTGDSPIGNSFVGSHLFTFDRSSEDPLFRWWLWRDNFPPATLHRWMPVLIILMSFVITYIAWIKRPPVLEPWRAKAIGVLGLALLSSVITVGFLVSAGANPRYLMHVLPTGYSIVAVGAWLIWRLVPHGQTLGRLVRLGLVIAVVAPTLFYAASAASWRIDHPGASPDYWSATAWASANKQADEIALIALPPSAYFWFVQEDYDRLRFLAGPEESLRTHRYIRMNRSGEPGDYWLGIEPIGSIANLCQTLRAHHGGAWIVVDTGRLNADWAFLGGFRNIILGTSEEQFRGHAGVMVRFVLPTSEWTTDAHWRCENATSVFS